MEIKILQWNVWVEEKVENIIKLLNEIDADIICLQELSTNAIHNPNIDIPKKIAKDFHLHYFYKAGHVWPKGTADKIDQGNAIFSKFPIKNTFSQHIQKDEVANYKGGKWDYGKEGRVYLECELTIDGNRMIVGTTHVSYSNKFFLNKRKKKEINNLVSILKTKKENYIFTGDLNSRPYSYCIKQISKYLKHCGPDFKEKTWTTKKFDYGGFKENKPNWRIDYIFATKDIQVKKTTIVKTEYSDHLPILAIIKIN